MAYDPSANPRDLSGEEEPTSVDPEVAAELLETVQRRGEALETMRTAGWGVIVDSLLGWIGSEQQALESAGLTELHDVGLHRGRVQAYRVLLGLPEGWRVQQEADVERLTALSESGAEEG